MGFFGLSSSEYTKRISTYSDGLLREEEISRMQQVYGAKLRIGAGVGFAVHSGDLSLVSAAVSGRSLDVAKRKLEMIQGELRRRDILCPRLILSRVLGRCRASGESQINRVFYMEIYECADIVSGVQGSSLFRSRFVRD